MMGERYTTPVARRPLARSVAVLAGTALIAAGCGSEGGDGAGSGPPQSGGSIVYAINMEPLSLDPALCPSQGWERCEPIFGTFLRINPDTDEFEPNLALSFDSEDGRHWTLKLRDGVKFSDGTDFDAEAVAYNWDRIKDPATLSRGYTTAASMEWEVIDPLTLEITLDSPNYQLPWAMVQEMGMIGSPTAIKKAGEDVGSKPVGAGPFILKRWARDSQLELERNPNYWRKGRPYADAITIKVIPEDSQRLNALRSGEIDVNWSLLTADAKAMEEEGYQVIKRPLVGGTGLMFNFKDPVVRDPTLRQALWHAFDADQINRAIYPGDPGTDAFLSPDHEYRDDSLGKFPEKDLEEAQRLFDEYLAKTGQSSLQLTFSTYADIPALAQVSEIIQSQMQKIEGLTFEIKGMEAVALSEAVSADDYQVAMGATLSQQMDYLYRIFYSGSSGNLANYSNPALDKALDASRESNDPKEVAEAYKVVAAELSKNPPLRTWRWQTGYLITAENVHVESPVTTRTGAWAWTEDVWIEQ